MEEIKKKGKLDPSIYKAKNVKKSKLEKSIELLGNSFIAASEKESEMMMKIEQNRHKEMLEHEIRLKELDNDRRREERQHELMLFKMLSQNRNQAPPQEEINFNPSVMYGAPMMNYMQSPKSSAHASSSVNRPTYFKLLAGFILIVNELSAAKNALQQVLCMFTSRYCYHHQV